jgi:ParB-like chromosome segregation protein Spo0J
MAKTALSLKLSEDFADRRRDRKLEILQRRIDSLQPDPQNPRVHSRSQLKRLARSIKHFGFIVPILIDSKGRVIAGHGRLLAARLLGWDEVPTICIEHLIPEQVRAFQIADNRLSELATWDTRVLGVALQALSDLNLDIELTGFEPAESDLLIQGLTTPPAGEVAPLV